MGYNKNELSSAKNMLYSLSPYNGRLSTTATFFCPQGGRFGEVRLYYVICDLFLHLRRSAFYCFIFWAFYRWYVVHLTMPISINLCKMMFFLDKNLIVAFLFYFIFFSWLQHLLSRRRIARAKQRLVNLLLAQPSRWNMNISVFLCPYSCLLLDSSYLCPWTNVTESNKSFLYFVQYFLVLLLGSFNSLLTDASISGTPRVGPCLSLVIFFDFL